MIINDPGIPLMMAIYKKQPVIPVIRILVLNSDVNYLLHKYKNEAHQPQAGRQSKLLTNTLHI